MRSKTKRTELAPGQKQYVQFSKKVTIAVTVLWGIFRFLSLAIMAFRPSIAEALTSFQQGVDDVMMVSIGFYCGNSVSEKAILGYFGAKRKEHQEDETYYDEDEEVFG